MARVTQDVQPQNINTPDYLNLSRGTDKAKAIADTSVGDIFKDLGNILPAAAKAAYNEIDQKISRGLQDQVNHVRNIFGVDDAVVAAAKDQPITGSKGDANNSLFEPAFKAGRGTPAGVARLGNTMSNLQDAYQQGKLSETYYNARLMQIVKEAKAANPGFEEAVDQHIKQITGIDPANALRKSIQNDLDMAERARQSAMSKEEAYVKQNQEYLTRETFEKINSGDRSPKTMAQANLEIFNRLSHKTEVDAALKDLELTDKNDKQFQTKATRTAGMALDQYVNTEFFQMSDATAGSSGILVKIRNHDVSKPWTTQELDELRGSWNMVKQEFTVNIDAILSRQEFSGMDASAKKAARDAAIARVEVIENALTNKEFGILASNENYVKAMNTADGRKLLENSDWFRKNAAIGNFPGGREFLNMMAMRTDGAWMQKGIQAARDLERLNLATRTKSLGGIIGDRMELARKQANEGSPEAYTRTIQDAATGLINAPTGGVAENYAESIYGPDNAGFWGKIDPASKPRVYAMLTSPEATKKMIEVGKSNPELYESYQKFAVDGFNNLFRTKIQNISTEARWANSPIKIEWDDKNGKFVPSYLPGQRQAVMGGTAKGAYDSLDQQINEVNRAITTLGPILDGGKTDTKRVLMDIFEANGWKNGVKDPGLVQRLGDAISGFFKSDDKKVEGDSGKWQYAGMPEGKSVKSDYTPSQGPKISLENKNPDFGDKSSKIKAVIRQAEASGDYNAVFGSKNKIGLTKMSLDEVMDLQKQMRASGSPSTAVGGYQFLNRTLADLKAQLKLSGAETFDENLQEKLADALLHKRGFGKYLNGEMGHKELVDRLAQEWAGLPNTKGKSHYDGDGLNRSTVKLRSVLDALKAIDQS